MIQKLLLIFCFTLLSWNWSDSSIKKADSLWIQKHWTRDSFQEGVLRRRLINSIQPLITEEQVIQGNALDGVKAYDKKSGRLLWSFYVPSGVASPMLIHKGSLYFGGSDGFFYSLDLEKGSLRWKYFSSSENTGQPFIYGNEIYFLSQNQKLYVLDLNGKLLWVYSRKMPSRKISFRTHTRPIADKNFVYSAFQDGFVVALSRKDFSVQWEKKLSTVLEPLDLKDGCLLVPVLDTGLLCLNPANGKNLWSIKGGSAVLFHSSFIYQFHKGFLYAYCSQCIKNKTTLLHKNKPRLLWKKKLEIFYPFSPAVVLEKFLVYGSSSKGELQIIDKSNGDFIAEHSFGNGLAGRIAVDDNQKTLYFFSIDAYLHKISLIPQINKRLKPLNKK